jgi:sensor histidine kinase YesM
VDENLDQEELMIPPMMIQPFVENAVKHGVTHLKAGGKIELEFSRKGQILECSVKDNGIGRTASAKLNAEKTRKHQSAALAVTTERLHLLNKQSERYKSLEIIDLKHDDGSVAGTQVLLRMPLEEW